MPEFSIGVALLIIGAVITAYGLRERLLAVLMDRAGWIALAASGFAAGWTEGQQIALKIQEVIPLV